MRYITYKNLEERRQLIEKLLILWEKSGWRFCQVVSNLHGVGPQDIFHTYDDKLEEMIDDILEKGWYDERDSNKT